MRKIKKGDIVGRISYGKDIFFIVEDIINLNKNEIAILKGLTIRIKADSPVEDLEILSKELIQNYEEYFLEQFLVCHFPVKELFSLIIYLHFHNMYNF